MELDGRRVLSLDFVGAPHTVVNPAADRPVGFPHDDDGCRRDLLKPGTFDDLNVVGIDRLQFQIKAEVGAAGVALVNFHREHVFTGHQKVINSDRSIPWT